LGNHIAVLLHDDLQALNDCLHERRS
jgi:hypothetical protein